MSRHAEQHIPVSYEELKNLHRESGKNYDLQRQVEALPTLRKQLEQALQEKAMLSGHCEALEDAISVKEKYIAELTAKRKEDEGTVTRLRHVEQEMEHMKQRFADKKWLRLFSNALTAAGIGFMSYHYVEVGFRNLPGVLFLVFGILGSIYAALTPKGRTW